MKKPVHVGGEWLGTTLTRQELTLDWEGLPAGVSKQCWSHLIVSLQPFFNQGEHRCANNTPHTHPESNKRTSLHASRMYRLRCTRGAILGRTKETVTQVIFCLWFSWGTLLRSTAWGEMQTAFLYLKQMLWALSLLPQSPAPWKEANWCQKKFLCNNKNKWEVSGDCLHGETVVV